MLTAIDGQVTGGGGVDRFRIKIWHYDNQVNSSDEGALREGTAIGGGSIVIHRPK